jgi:hypothetical protein
MSLLLTSCSPSRYCARKFPPTTDTIISVDTVWRERTIRLEFPADTADLVIPQFEIDRSQGKPIIRFSKSQKAKVEVRVDSTGISAKATCAEQDSLIKILESEIKRKENITTVQHIPVKTVPWYLKWAGYWALVSIPLFIIGLIARLKKLFTIL